ncbi:MAG TPA: mismatch-specific DNA-glycosylase [Acidimicrobiales bacterium]|nr:mismatch-specific DNA-glycosylase [Acidimicrobiales bacterium]
MTDLGATALVDVPLALWHLHRATSVGQRVRVRLPAGACHDFLLEGAGFSPDGTRLRTLADCVGSGMRLLVCGLNPSLYAADAGIGFARPGNRFWPAMLAAGLATVDRDPLALLVDRRIGMTDIVKRATVGAGELRPAEYVHGVERLERLAGWLQPAAVCFVGFDGWRKAVDRRATAGWQAQHLGGRPVYLMPNPSGLNAHTNVAALAAHFTAAVTSGPCP